jgi:hypothetical protein
VSWIRVLQGHTPFKSIILWGFERNDDLQENSQDIIDKVEALNSGAIDITFAAEKAGVINHGLIEGSKPAARREHSLTVREAVSQHKSVVFWVAFFCLPNIIIGYDPTILGTLVGIPGFRKRFGYEYPTGSSSFVL